MKYFNYFVNHNIPGRALENEPQEKSLGVLKPVLIPIYAWSQVFMDGSSSSCPRVVMVWGRSVRVMSKQLVNFSLKNITELAVILRVCVDLYMWGGNVMSWFGSSGISRVRLSRETGRSLHSRKILEGNSVITRLRRCHCLTILTERKD